MDLPEVLRIAARFEEMGFVERAARVLVVRAEASLAGVTLADEELQGAADRFRASRGLGRAADTFAWLEERALTAEDLEARLRDEVLEERLRARVTDEEVRAWFERSRESLDEVDAWLVQHPDEGVMREIDLLLREGEPFEALARRYSHDHASAAAGGWLGRVLTRTLPPSLQEAARRATPGQLLPITEVEDGWAIYRIDASLPASLDPLTTARARTALFEAWLTPRVRSVARVLFHVD